TGVRRLLNLAQRGLLLGKLLPESDDLLVEIPVSRPYLGECRLQRADVLLNLAALVSAHLDFEPALRHAVEDRQAIVLFVDDADIVRCVLHDLPRRGDVVRLPRPAPPRRERRAVSGTRYGRLLRDRSDA